MADPWLSVLMPIHRGAATLPRTLAALPAPEAGIEVIAVVQDGSDGSREMLAVRPGLRILDAPDSGSWMQNTNIALKAARAPLVTMLHQDDLWRPGRARALWRLADHWPEASLWLHGAAYVDASDREVGRIAPPFGPRARLVPGQEALSHLLVQNTVALPAAMFRRADALEAGGLDETLWYTADWELWLRLARRGPVGWDPRALAAFRVHAGSLTLTGSRDGAEFRAQLAAPLERHLGALPAGAARRIGRRALLSNRLNVALAATYHGGRGELLRSLIAVGALGPAEARRFLRDTRLIQRVAPRLRLKFRRGAA